MRLSGGQLAARPQGVVLPHRAMKLAQPARQLFTRANFRRRGATTDFTFPRQRAGGGHRILGSGLQEGNELRFKPTGAPTQGVGFSDRGV